MEGLSSPTPLWWKLRFHTFSLLLEGHPLCESWEAVGVGATPLSWGWSLSLFRESGEVSTGRLVPDPVSDEKTRRLQVRTKRQPVSDEKGWGLRVAVGQAGAKREQHRSHSLPYRLGVRTWVYWLKLQKYPKYINKLESIQRSVTKVISKLQKKSYVERLIELNSLILSKRRLRDDLIQVIKIFHDIDNIKINDCVTTDLTSTSRSLESVSDRMKRSSYRQ